MIPKISLFTNLLTYKDLTFAFSLVPTTDTSMTPSCSPYKTNLNLSPSLHLRCPQARLSHHHVTSPGAFSLENCIYSCPLWGFSTHSQQNDVLQLEGKLDPIPFLLTRLASHHSSGNPESFSRLTESSHSGLCPAFNPITPQPPNSGVSFVL